MFGASVAGLGDIDGDGRADYAVGAPGDAQFTGFARVYSGSSGAVLRTISASSPGGEFGRTLAALGDVTGDGVAELVVAEPAIVLDQDAGGNPSRQGRVHVYSGADGQSLATLDSSLGYKFGVTLTSVNDDDDQDGFGDLYIGATPLADPMNLDAAMVAVYSGPSLSQVFTSTFGALVTGTSPLQSSPPIGDLDGDGIVGTNDLAVMYRSISASGPSDPSHDLNADGFVDTGDLAIVIDHFGEGPSSPAYGVESCGRALTYLGIVWAVGMFGCSVIAVYFTGGFGLAACWSFWTNSYLSYGGAAVGAGCIACSLQSLFLNDPNVCP
ncbi:MAG: hypothetical protein D6692_08630 [Planctomycetota bacterium]|nr:MAG: hypothetical protein D6692_08630 [Planctomycetota bacterium]